MSTRSAYYGEMRALALAKRAQYGIETSALNLRVVRGIYREENIRIDSWEVRGQKIRAAYFCDSGDYSVLVNKKLPKEPKLFSLVHELKHHYVDQKAIEDGSIKCGDYNAHEVIEKGAEVFAAEFIYPEREMRRLADRLKIERGTCRQEAIVEFKRLCPAPVSYRFLVKRFEWFGFCEPGEFQKVQFQKLEEAILGVPFYKQQWFKDHRTRKKQLLL